MELKKSDKANLDKRRGLFIEIGLLLALGFTLLAFEWPSKPKEEKIKIGNTNLMIDEEVIPVTRQDETPPPPPPEPPKVTDILDIVSDDVHVESNIDINVETNQNVAIDIVEFKEAAVVEEEEEQVFTIVEDMPLFNGKPAEEGFREYVGKNTQYPAVAQENGISGRVFVEFTINQRGELVDAKVVRPVDPSLDNEALRVVRSSPKWTPGKQLGKTV